MIGQWVSMCFYDKLAHAKNSVYQARVSYRIFSQGGKNGLRAKN